jgi:hypothetical protein
MSLDDRFLPVLEFDRTLVFWSGPVLWEQTRPVLPVVADFHASHTKGEAHLVCASVDHDVSGYLIDDL